ncbi:unnamed protein product [Penicillium discolor]
MIDSEKRDKEANLFDVFKEPDKTQNVEKETGLISRLFKPKESWKGRDTYNPYGDTAGETELLREVKDICDELDMLKFLALDQESVWKQIWKGGSNPDATFTYNTPSEVKKGLRKWSKRPKTSEYCRSRISRKQSDTIMVFTVVTILFLPASFITSLLALNISD